LDLRWLDRVIHPEDRERTLEHWLGAVAGRHRYDIEYRIRAANGTYRWFQTRGVPLRNTHGAIVKWFGTCTDIDDLKKADDALRTANRELEEFAYVASHDLQEPLRMINIYTQLLVRRHAGDDAQAQHYASIVHRGVNRMETLIQDLLTFSRTIHTEDSDARQADLAAALAEAISVLQDRIDKTGALICAPPLPVVYGNAGQLALVFQNLLANALKYQSNGTRPEINIAAHRDGTNWIIAVRDNGIGFEPRYAERIFGLFKRLHTEQYPGTGLGLAICRRIVERYKGRIWAESTPGSGSTFYFSLPQPEEP
jgi:light-regulated signal transduction histidine kinase (bacteriophytochrome)